MKKTTSAFFKTLVLIVALALAVPTTVDAGNGRDKKFKHHHRHKKGKTVGAPLDGGILLLLAGAGAAYFGVRKKNKES